ncbi:hypothetical protein DHW03_03245 [Pedobacter yonginense]|uniref:Peptidase S74 domain-containing protein n=1 Tax=Pedobacter yonginense TaxID=651869 RepID=A0A317ESL8_9SPHI|nr:hypothetical protein [Pedobacter yonginense]PWS28863.1 hypothetical protein DHW03_03245 [Pedobacter yonginense]
MKKLLLSLIALAITLNALAQDPNILIGLNDAYGIKIKANFPGSTSGWARGYYLTNENNTKNFFGIGVLGYVNNGISSPTYGWIGKDYNDVYMSFISNGNVGIGTTNPSTKLEVVTSSNTNLFGLTKNTIGWGEGPGMAFRNLVNDGTQPDIARIQAGLLSGTSGAVAGSLNFFTKNLNKEVMAMTMAPNGNIGIGTASPTVPLDIISTYNTNLVSLTKNSIVGGEGPEISFRNLVNDGTQPTIAKITSKLLNGGAGAVAGSLSFFTRNNSADVLAMTIAPNGFIGMGTASPKEALSVNGNIRAKEIKVEATNWPDYVFEDGYKVGTLGDLEAYIKANRHLPEMPSAKEAEASGVELGEMNRKLLQKIEELTLYVIEQGKEIAELKKQVRKK